LGWIQNKLFDIGGLLATAPGQVFDNMPQITTEDSTRLERLMDTCHLELPPLKEFILPGGGILGSHLHLARTICRRAERRCVSLMRREDILPSIVVFLNRLSDALFVLARWVSRQQGEPEVYWQRETPRPPPSRKRR
jgi:cob(I)alamin adenosyltransferase